MNKRMAAQKEKSSNRNLIFCDLDSFAGNVGSRKSRDSFTF